MCSADPLTACPRHHRDRKEECDEDMDDACCRGLLSAEVAPDLSYAIEECGDAEYQECDEEDEPE